MFQNGAIPSKMEASRFRLMKPHFDATVKKTDFVFGVIDGTDQGYPNSDIFQNWLIEHRTF